MTARPDVVVVGAGVNGLVCATYLARAGLRVTVLEAGDAVGGSARTVAALGARFDAGAGDLPSLQAGPIMDELALAAHGLRYLAADPGLAGVGWDRRRAGPSAPLIHFADPERTLAALAATHPRSVEAYRRYLGVAQPAARLLLDLAHEVPAPGTALRRMLAHRGRAAATLLSWNRRPAARVLRSLFADEDLVATACVLGPARLGLPPSARRSGLAALVYALGHVAPAGRPAGGTGMVATALHRALLAAGGTVRTRAPVAAVLAEGERARGVRLAGGEEVEAGVAVVVACDARRAIVSWLRDPPPIAQGMVQRWAAARPRDGYASTLQAVVSGPPPRLELPRRLAEELGVREPAVATVAVHPGVAGLEQNHWELGPGRVGRRPALLLAVPSALDPSLRPGAASTPAGGTPASEDLAGRGPSGEAPSGTAPADGHVATLTVLWTPYDLAGGWQGSGEPERWLGFLDQICGAGTVERVERWRAVTPPDHERQLGLVRGRPASYPTGALAGLQARDPERVRYRTPLEGLYLAGADTFPGSTMPGAPGRNAARVVLATAGERRRLSRGRPGAATEAGSEAVVAVVADRPGARPSPPSPPPPPARRRPRSAPRPTAPR